MLSILIPTYNYPLLEKVIKLKNQCDNLGIVFEIICQDDASNSNHNIENLKINTLENCYFTSLKKNVAHRQNRNLLAEKAKYQFLLFIDGDSNIIKDDYISSYIQYLGKFQVIYGGRIHPEKCPSENQSLRWKYGIQIEDKIAKERSKKTYECLLFNNTLIEKTIFDSIQFDKKLVKYGHDDTQLSFALKLNKTTVLHIDNPVEHGDIDNNDAYLEKTKQSLEVLMQLYLENKIEPKFNKLLKLYLFLKKIRLKNFFSILFTGFEKKITQNLLGKNPSMFFFNLFKIGYFCRM